MPSAREGHREAGAEGRATDFDAVVVGAGFSGLYMLHRLRNEMGLSARVYETGDGVGGTWYWNRYPGARSDSDSYIYSYSFSKELRQEWEWSERYPEQGEIQAYLEHVTDRLDLRRDILFSTRVIDASFDEKEKVWRSVRTRETSSRRGSSSPPPGRSRWRACPTSQGATPLQGRPTTPGNGRTRVWTLPASGSASLAPEPRRSRPFR
ncbi:MAG: Cyclohexanone monooxygenase [uncultured Rubrobacteraceae bacterium]|uniref:Cyclohexanone monooxygenase n=1 Tax=uncultured Rubrobacteraceae bacterium TaxID=349277 RepID=A0A6J4Q3E8_9ACTN|nr:MAG: Cyclohexanone monooxygenase [uncultured Rubrobacteraceae bacterium]